MRVVVAVAGDSTIERVDQLPDGVRVASEYPAMTRRYFAERGVDADVRLSYGARSSDSTFDREDERTITYAHGSSRIQPEVELCLEPAMDSLRLGAEFFPSDPKLKTRHGSWKCKYHCRAIQRFDPLACTCHRHEGKVYLLRLRR